MAAQMITWTLSLDGVLTSSALIAGLVLLWRLAARFTNIEDRLEQLTRGSAQIATAITTLAVQQQRLDHLEQMMWELRHGDGMVLPLRKSPFEAGGR